jgi:hypothetical protein
MPIAEHLCTMQPLHMQHVSAIIHLTVSRCSVLQQPAFDLSSLNQCPHQHNFADHLTATNHCPPLPLPLQGAAAAGGRCLHLTGHTKGLGSGHMWSIRLLT